MRTQLEIWLYSITCRQLFNLYEFISLEATKTENEPGALSVILTQQTLSKLASRIGVTVDSITEDLIDNWILVYRTYANTRKILLDTAWIIRDPVKALDESGKYYVLTAPGANDILRSRWMQLYPGSTNDYATERTDEADDMMKALVREHFKTAFESERNISDSYFTVQADTTLAPIVDKEYLWRNIYDIILELAQASAEHDTTPKNLYFDIVPIADNPLKQEFRTYVNQRGIDRSSASGKPLEFSIERGNLINPSLEYNYIEEYNAITAGGAGVDDERTTRYATDTARATRGPFSRRELFVDVSSVTDGDAVQDEANAALYASKPKRVFNGDILSVPHSLYGLDWDYGDRVVARFDNDVFDCRVHSVTVTYESGAEVVTGSLVNDN